MDTLQVLNIRVDLQNPNDLNGLPKLSDVQLWCEKSIQTKVNKIAFENSLSVLIRIVDETESAKLNKEYRDKDGSTNVLSFPNDVPDFMREIPELKEQNSSLGDLVICESLVRKEASEQGKDTMSHWAHLIVHGVLHLQGFDHIDDTEAQQMEGLEIQIMEQFGFTNPYTNVNK